MALHHVNLTVEPGETLALVGATGSGKSVLTGLLSRLYDVTEEASIRVDGVDIRDLRPVRSCARAVATAFEDPTLFSMSVAGKISVWAALRTTPRPKRSWPPLSTSPPAGFVYDLPFGLDTRIGEQGMSLSGGQRQRLSLARAIVAAPAILVLDDTLSALDVHTEAARDRGVAQRAARGDGRGCRESRVDGAAGRSGCAAREGHHHPRRYPLRTVGDGAASTATCWRPTTSSTTTSSTTSRGRATTNGTG